jgi:hypothetical protein
MPLVPLGRTQAHLSASQQTVPHSRNRHCHTMPAHKGCTAGTGSLKRRPSPLLKHRLKTPHHTSRVASKTGVEARQQQAGTKGYHPSHMHTSHKNGPRQGPSQRDLAEEQVNKQRMARCIAPAHRQRQALGLSKLGQGPLQAQKHVVVQALPPNMLLDKQHSPWPAIVKTKSPSNTAARDQFSKATADGESIRCKTAGRLCANTTAPYHTRQLQQT